MSAPVHYDNTIGALLLCSWFNSALFTIEGLQIYEYFSRFNKNDSLLNRGLVASAVVADTAGVVANMAAVYLYSTTHFGDVAFAQSQPWPLPMYVTASGLSAAITQVYLALRIYRLTNQLAYPILFIGLTMGMLGGALGTSISVISANSLEDRDKLQTTVRVWLSCAASVDILLAFGLVFILARTRTDFKETGHILRRLMYAAVKTGSLTAGFALIALVLYSVHPNDNVHVFFSLSLGRLYSISMLANLNARHSNDGTSRGPSSGDLTSSHGRSDARGVKSSKSRTNKGIKITSETVTRVDDNRDLEQGGDVIQLSERRSERSTGMIPINESAMNPIAYSTPNAWDAESLDRKSLEDSQVDLVQRR